MYREILFRAKTKNGEVVYGSHHFDGTSHYIKSQTNNKRFGCGIEVIPETISQYVGKCDKNGTKIFENDIVKVPEGYCGDYFYTESTGIIEYEDGGFLVNTDGVSDTNWEDLEVIGNLFSKIIAKPIYGNVVEGTIVDVLVNGGVGYITDDPDCLYVGIIGEDVFFNNNDLIDTEEEYDVFGGMEGDNEPGFGED